MIDIHLYVFSTVTDAAILLQAKRRAPATGRDVGYYDSIRRDG
jgi:hypothetical protein